MQIHITQNTPSNLKHISEKIQIDSLNFVILLYKIYTIKDRDKKIEAIKEANSCLGVLFFQVKLLYDLKITSSSQNSELANFIGVLYDNIFEWVTKITAENKK